MATQPPRPQTRTRHSSRPVNGDGPPASVLVKDIIAHVMWSELEIVPVMGTHVLSGSELWNLSEDERNEIVYQQYRDRPLQDIVTEERRVYDHFLEAAQTLSDEDLNDSHHFRDMPEPGFPGASSLAVLFSTTGIICPPFLNG